MSAVFDRHMIRSTRRPLVGCVGVTRRFGTGDSAVAAVHTATCHVRPAQRIALTGPPGSGKTTLLHLMAGLDQPSAGTITWPALGRRTCLHPHLIVVVSSRPVLLPTLDVVDNVALPLVLAGVDAADARERAGSATRRDRLTNGLGDRVGLAVAIELVTKQVQEDHVGWAS